MDKDFIKDVETGLSKSPKKISPKYFYDEKGDELFIKIMNMPEYYLTDAEFEIFSEQSSAIIDKIGLNGKGFDVYELGAGDGTKTMEFLKELKGKDFNYLPVDISGSSIDKLSGRIKKEMPWVKFKGMQGDYFKVIQSLNGDKRKVVLFLGSNLGNLDDSESKKFLNKIGEALQKGDHFIIGVDLKKSKEVVLPAYNDKQGITRDFNLNLLHRINKEMDGDFNLNHFQHSPHYDEKEGIAYSYLESTKVQEVELKALGKKFRFQKGEKIHTEISRKYDDQLIKNLFKGTGLKLKAAYSDKRNYFSDYLFEKV